jgi:hypothetical protein
VNLAPLGSYGGPTQTIPALDGNAIDSAFATAITSDQRGFPIIGTPDVGAYEAGNLGNFNAWSIETIGIGLSFGGDEEFDGAVNGLEYATRRDPFASDTPLSPIVSPDGTGHAFQFRYRADARDLRYVVQRSTDLTNVNGWTEIYRYDSSTGLITETGVTGNENPGTELITLTDPTLGPQAFWRLRIERVP